MGSPAGFGADYLLHADGSHQQTVERVIVAMRERVDDALPLRAMAEIAHLSPYHFARVFRQVTGIPPGEFLSALRLERAKQLLLTTHLSVAEICFEVGYNSLGTFTTRFTRLVGLTPGRMRRLPEEVSLAFGQLRGRDLNPLRVALPGAGVTFRVGGADLAGTLIFVGLFPGAIPQRRPVAGRILTAPGTYQLSPVPDGRYHLMAAALPHFEDPLEQLLPGDALRVGRAREPLRVRDGRVDGRVDVTLRPVRPTDPPVLVSLAALLVERLALERCAGRVSRQRAR